MSWISDIAGGYVSGLGNTYKGIIHGVTGGAGYARDLEDFIQREMVDKASLRGTQVEGFMSGLPGVGGVIKGVDNVQQMEDLYNNTGKTSAYPGVSSSGLSSAGRSVPGLARKIEEGTHDLFEHYSGTKDDTIRRFEEEGMRNTQELMSQLRW